MLIISSLSGRGVKMDETMYDDNRDLWDPTFGMEDWEIDPGPEDADEDA